jgi:peptide/nickel transport system substrate-binding protein
MSPDDIEGPAHLESWRGTRRVALQRGAAAAATLGFGGVLSPVAGARTRRTGAKTKLVTMAFSDASLTDTLDPAHASNSLTAALATALYDPLLHLDNNDQPVPFLAGSFNTNSDGSVWTFHLRKAKFADGKPITAHDVAYTFQRLLDKRVGATLHGALSQFLAYNSFHIIDSHTLQMRLTKPNVFLHELIADLHAGIVPNHAVKFTGVGSGAFRVKSFTPAQGFKLEPNPYYWDHAVPASDAIVGLVIPDQATKLQAVLHGSADICDPIDFSSLGTVRGQHGVKVLSAPGTSYRIEFDPRKAPFNDVRVLQAMKLACDRKQIVSLVFQGAGSPTYDTPIPTTSPTFPKDLIQNQNIAKAKQLLAAAGYPNGIDAELWTSQAFAGMVDLAVVYANQVKAAGIRLNVQQAPPDTYWDQYFMVKQGYISYWSVRPPYMSLSQEFLPGNEVYFDNQQFNSLLAQIARTVNKKKQYTLFKQAQRILASTSGAILPAIGAQEWVARSSVEGLAFTATGRPDVRLIRKV